MSMFFGKDKFTTRRQKNLFKGGGGNSNYDYGKSIYQDLAETTAVALGGTLTVAGAATVTGQVFGTGNDQLLGKLIGANMNVTTDQAIPITRIGTQKYLITKIFVTNASTSLTAADGGIYTATSKGGTAIVAAAQVYTALTAATVGLDLTLAVNNTYTLDNIYLSLTGAQGGAATADIYVFGIILPA